MTSAQKIEAAIDKAKELMAEIGLDSDVSYEDFVNWFESEVPVPDVSIGDVVLDPLLVVHELAEIQEVLKMGLELSREVLARNQEKVRAAHMRATAADIAAAKHRNAVDHVKRRARELEEHCANESLPEFARTEYRKLLMHAKELLSDLEKSHLLRTS